MVVAGATEESAHLYLILRQSHRSFGFFVPCHTFFQRPRHDNGAVCRRPFQLKQLLDDVAHLPTKNIFGFKRNSLYDWAVGLRVYVFNT